MKQRLNKNQRAITGFVCIVWESGTYLFQLRKHAYTTTVSDDVYEVIHYFFDRACHFRNIRLRPDVRRKGVIHINGSAIAATGRGASAVGRLGEC